MSNAIIGFKDEYMFLSNFYLSEVEFEGMVYKSAEAAFQAAKSLNKKDREGFQKINPLLAKKLGKKLTLRDDWEEIKEEVMYKILLDKFTRNNMIRDKLIETNDSELINDNILGNTFWGQVDGIGENRLGKILMKIREELNE